MGISFNQLAFLLYVKKFGNFNKTITLGRQNLDPSKRLAKLLLPSISKYKEYIYADRLLEEYFHSSIVDSVDVSDYEGATIIHDMNKPLPNELKGQYDTVIDSGTLEHVYNVPQALENCSLLCKPGGQIIHMLPANNVCGHGFWQMSPELFFSFYSVKNGYKDTEVYLAKSLENKYFYRVIEPKKGERVEIRSSLPVNAFVRTVLGEKGFSHENVQQSDYTYLWLHGKPITKNESKMSIFKNFLEDFPQIYYLAVPINNLVTTTFFKFTGTHMLSKSNRQIVRIKMPHKVEVMKN